MLDRRLCNVVPHTEIWCPMPLRDPPSSSLALSPDSLGKARLAARNIAAEVTQTEAIVYTMACRWRRKAVGLFDESLSDEFRPPSQGGKLYTCIRIAGYSLQRRKKRRDWDLELNRGFREYAMKNDFVFELPFLLLFLVLSLDCLPHKLYKSCRLWVSWPMAVNRMRLLQIRGSEKIVSPYMAQKRNTLTSLQMLWTDGWVMVGMTVTP